MFNVIVMVVQYFAKCWRTNSLDVDESKIFLPFVDQIVRLSPISQASTSAAYCA